MKYALIRHIFKNFGVYLQRIYWIYLVSNVLFSEAGSLKCLCINSEAQNLHLHYIYLPQCSPHGAFDGQSNIGSCFSDHFSIPLQVNLHQFSILVPQL